MPGRPLLSVRRGARFTQDARVFLDKPELAALVAAIIARWAKAEANLGTVLLVLSGPAVAAVSATYAVLKSPQAKMDMLRAIAGECLATEAADTFKAVIAYLKHGWDLRNRMAHGLWGFSSELPEPLLVVDAGVVFKRDRNEQKLLYGPTLDPDELRGIHPKDIFVFFREDLEEGLALVERCYGYTQKLCDLCSPMTASGDSGAERLFKEQFVKISVDTQNWLRNELHIQTILSRPKSSAPGS